MRALGVILGFIVAALAAYVIWTLFSERSASASEALPSGTPTPAKWNTAPANGFGTTVTPGGAGTDDRGFVKRPMVMVGSVQTSGPGTVSYNQQKARQAQAAKNVQRAQARKGKAK